MKLKQRIQLDARRLAGDPEASALHACLVKHLFDPNLDTNYLTRACGATRGALKRMAAELGSLKGYSTELRMIEAERLVRETDLPFQEISQRLGYPVRRTFYRAFKDYHRLTPGEMRQQARDQSSDDAQTLTGADIGAPETAAPMSDADGSRRDSPEPLTPKARVTRWRRRLVIGLVDDNSAAEMRSRLRRRYPGTQTKPPDPEASSTHGDSGADSSVAPTHFPLVLMPTGDDLEVAAAKSVLSTLLTQPRSDLRHALLEGLRTGSSTAFDVLLEMCWSQTRWDAETAVMAAELSVQMLEIHREILGD